ncbi:unnamed protein product [Oppiella nova]|uniref:Spaetzle domain-containing protein n=1 Tax=Oppiella nova TaxID=334625 RepID=A0A7R9QIC5_9ACAR|nr:unnamed protein product [Oppiella nova]CAG2165593.1 unnamed protein product [Oppiella nova]
MKERLRRGLTRQKDTVVVKSKISEKQSNVSASESRTLSSWLGLDLNRFRRPQFKLKPFFSPPQPPPQPQNIHPYVAPPPPQVLPPLLSPPNSFPGPHDPESLFLPQNMFEESGIKYWLKFIENAGNDDNIHSDEYNGRPTMTHDDSRMRRPTKYSSRPKPIDIGDKPNSDDDNDDNESEDESEDNNENEDDMEEPTDEPKSSGSSHSKQKYDTTPRCDKFTSDICVDDFEYPEQAIVDEIYKRRDIFELMYSEVSGNVPLVDGIPRDVEESYNYDYYYNDNKDPQASGSGFGDEEKQLSPGKGSSVCPTEVLYGKPKLAKNKRGDWKVIVNAAEFTQTVRMEKCIKPNMFEKGKGFYIDTFRMPTACTCHVTRRVSYKPLPSASQSTNFNKKQKPSPPLSNTLWSILGGPLPNDPSGTLSQSQELLRNQINLLNQMKHLPQLAHISPDNVFQQLMDLQSPSDGLSDPHNHQSHPSYQRPQKPSPMQFGQSGAIDYILPAIMSNEDQTNTDRFSGSDRKSQSQMPRPLAQIHQSSGTTTLLNPNVNGAPVVQVIHVPVTSAMAQNQDPAPVYKGKHHNNPTFSDYSYIDTSSLFYKPKQNSEEFLQTFGDDLSDINVDHFKPLMLGMSSKTNSSLISPNSGRDTVKRESDYPNSDSDEMNKKRKLMVENTLNKKINFSYHPILEYISR